MRSVQTVSVSLEQPYLDRLDRLSRRAGSRSAAVRLLLEEHERQRRLRAMEEAYRAYYGDPEVQRKNRGLTGDFLSIAAWPDDTPKGASRGGRRKRSPR